MEKNKIVADNCLHWFRDEFVPNASDTTIAILMFLYNKFAPDLKESADGREFIAEKRDLYLSTPVDRSSLN